MKPLKAIDILREASNEVLIEIRNTSPSELDYLGDILEKSLIETEEFDEDLYDDEDDDDLDEYDTFDDDDDVFIYHGV